MIRCLSQLPVLFCLAAFSAGTWAAPLEIAPYTTFHDSTHVNGYDEGSFYDNGGVLFIFVRNLGISGDSISSVRINGSNVSGLPGFRWSRTWPQVMSGNAGDNPVSAITVKAAAPPLAEGETITIEVDSALGATTSQTYTCATPKLRLGHVVPAADGRTVWLFVRNDDSVAHTIDRVEINGKAFIPGASPELTTVGGPTVGPGNLVITKVTCATTLAPMAPLAVAVRSQRSGGGSEWVAAPIRLLSSSCPIGAWSNMTHDTATQRHFRRMHGDLHTGDGDETRLTQMYNRYGIKTFPYTEVGSLGPPDPAYAQRNNDNDAIGGWHLRDEPDISGVSSTTMFNHNQVYWNNGPNHPSIMNLVSTRKFNEYGHIPDVAGMDHYSIEDAPTNVRGLHTSDAEEAYLWADQLKRNVEPKRTWVWSQLGAGMWGQQPMPWGVNVQFWSQLGVGVKGILWFVYDTGHETDPRYAAQTAEALKIGKQFNQIRDLVSFTDSLGEMGTSHPDVHAWRLVGEEAMIVIVANYNYEVANLLFDVSYTIHSSVGSVDVSVPHWIPIERVKQVMEDGLTTPSSYSVSDHVAHIDFTVHHEAAVYVIGKTDTMAPDPPAGGAFAELVNDTDFVIAWREPRDNIGVSGYRVYRNGNEVIDVDAPFWEKTGDGSIHDLWTIRAYDAEGNLGESGPPVTELRLLSPLASINVCEEEAAEFSIEAAGSGELRYQWFVEGLPAGTDSPVLSFPSVQMSDDGARVTCRVSDNRGSIMSGTAVLHVTICIPPDFDRDGDVDWSDFDHMAGCMAGAGLGPPAEGCEQADLDSDSDIDQSDFGLFQVCLSGTSIRADPNCID